MITNLVFKRTVNVEGSTRTEMKIIEVMLSELKSSEGWTLVSSADHVEVSEIPKCKSVSQIEEEEAVKKFTEEYRVTKAKQQIEESLKSQDRHSRILVDSEEPKDEPEVISTDEVNREYVDMQIEIAQDAYKNKVAKYDKITTVPSCCEGTACLIRVKDTIRISYRKGKQADHSSPNRVCISNYHKQLFFNEVKRTKGSSTDLWQLDAHDAAYNWWNKFVDDTYQAQRRAYIDKLIKEDTDASNKTEHI